MYRFSILVNQQSLSCHIIIRRKKSGGIICPQIREEYFQLEQKQNCTFFELSQYILKKLNLDQDYKAIVYNSEGHPLLYNLDLVHTPAPKLNLSKVYYVIFNNTISYSADMILTPTSSTEINTNPVDIVIDSQYFPKEKIIINIDLKNNLYLLKYKIFIMTGIPPKNQIISYKNQNKTKQLVEDDASLEKLQIVKGSTLQMKFKLISNVVNSSYKEKFYYRDVRILHPQDEQACRMFKSNLLALSYHLSDQEKYKFLSFIRQYTRNQPFVYALRTLFFYGCFNQSLRIAFQQGFFQAIIKFVKNCTPKPTTQIRYLFTHIRDFIGFVFSSIFRQQLSKMNAQFQKREKCIVMPNKCPLTLQIIKHPVLIHLKEEQRFVIYDQNFWEMNKNKFSDKAQSPKKEWIVNDPTLSQNFQIWKMNFKFMNTHPYSLLFLQNIFWLGSEAKDIPIKIQQYGAVDRYESLINQKVPDLKIHSPIQIKNKSRSNYMLLNQKKQYRIFIGFNKDVINRHSIFDVMTGQVEHVNLDLMSSVVHNNGVQIRRENLIQKITIQPKEAIMVLFDVSYSMGTKFFHLDNLERIGVCKQLFQNFAFRTIAYNLEHVVSLIFFNHKIDHVLDFTQSINDFNFSVSIAKPEGSTRLYDTIIYAVKLLVEFRKKYPKCLLRIIALTDGQDTCSIRTNFDAAKAIVDANVIIDSFAVGTNCQGLKGITYAGGGKCFLTRDINSSLTLFQQQTILSARARKTIPVLKQKTDKEIQNCLEKSKFQPFSLSDNLYQFNLPQPKGKILTSVEVIAHYKIEENQKTVLSSYCLRRINKQIQAYKNNPHPFVAIFPSVNINYWKILLYGPKQTPYQGGIFLLYCLFPENYPLRPPQIRFITPIYHCNVNQQGRICHSIFDRNYSPNFTFRQLIDCVFGLILTPQPDDPLDNVIASYYLTQYPKYVANAINSTKINASKTIEQITEEVFGEIKDQNQKISKMKEIKQWADEAKIFS